MAQFAEKQSKVVEEKFYVTNNPPQAYWGPIQIKHIQGKGRAVFASSDIEPGQLLMVSEPLVLLHSDDGDIPEAEQLLEYIFQKEFNPLEVQQLLDLHDGFPRSPDSAVTHASTMTASTSTSTSTSTTSSTTATSAENLPPSPSSNSSSGEDGGSAEEPDISKGVLTRGSDLDINQLYRIIVLNSFGEEAPDLPAAIMRGEELTPHAGLWYDFSMLNHSCSANAVNLVIGNNMVVRATRHISEGEEVCINYLGRGVLAPLGERQLQLEEGYGFTCSCSRCLVEGGRNAEFAEAAAEVQRLVERDLKPDLEVAAEKEDMQLLGEVVGEVDRLVRLLEEQERAVGCSREEGALIRAGAYEAYSVLAGASELDPHTWQEGPSLTCQEIIKTVGPGSDLHVLLATRHLSLVQKKYDPLGREAQAALAECRQAYSLRYGHVDPRVLETLVRNGAIAVERVVL